MGNNELLWHELNEKQESPISSQETAINDSAKSAIETLTQGEKPNMFSSAEEAVAKLEETFSAKWLLTFWIVGADDPIDNHSRIRDSINQKLTDAEKLWVDTKIYKDKLAELEITHYTYLLNKAFSRDGYKFVGKKWFLFITNYILQLEKRGVDTQKYINTLIKAGWKFTKKEDTE